MRGMPYAQAVRKSESGMSSSEYVAEALAKQAAARPPKGQPNLMPVTPTLPRMPKPHRRRRGV
ncbi:MAG: hypothetical protein JWO87_231 [Phycisphaerales bacterium]|jgi:hypothetical protein|nr:hypothetical protein [Phycisphaerales bacterium]MDB5298568.1 hypothetical protein [Phycisphaerales bacterium]MDB5305215.1 hypothetical protein [Phycisphaerales bacterium]